MDKIRVLIADDHTLFRRLLADMLEVHEDIEVVGQAASGAEAVDKVRGLRPHVVLMDLRMPGTNGVEATRIIRKEAPSTAILMLTMCDEDADLRAALQAGARGYLLKNAEPTELVHSIQLVSSGHAVIHPKMATCLIGRLNEAPAAESVKEQIPASSFGLTEREKEILVLLSQGASNKGIARALGITETTVKAHVHSVLNKLKLFNRVQAAKWAMENGLAPARR